MQGEVRLNQTKVKKANSPEISDFIIGVTREYQPHNVTITYFGGEPLANIAGIEAIYLRIKDSLPPTTGLKQIMITNGVLVPRYIERIRQCNISTLQITLDGPKDTHNQRRHGQKGKGSFDAVVKGITTGLDAGLFVAIHVVVDSHNAPHIQELAQFIKRKFGDRLDHLAVNIGLASNPGWDSQHCAQYLAGTKATAGQFVEAVEAVLGEGLQIIDFLTSSPCPRERDNEFIISPDGSLYKCISAVGRDAFCVGTINDPPLAISQKSAPFINFSAPASECKTCPYLPDCNGGCRFGAWVKTNQLYAQDCWKDFYAEAMPSLLFLYAKTESSAFSEIRKVSQV
jgi:uncharacterized protein